MREKKRPNLTVPFLAIYYKETSKHLRIPNIFKHKSSAAAIFIHENTGYLLSRQLVTNISTAINGDLEFHGCQLTSWDQ